MEQPTQEQRTVPVEAVIHFWECLLRDRAMLSISTATFIEATIKHLKKLGGNP